jgi:hypothetical protein
MQGDWKLLRAAASLGTVNGSSLPVPLCTFTLQAPALALTLPHFSAAAAAGAATSSSPSVRFTLGSDLQIVRWTVSVADAKEGARTDGSPSADVPAGHGTVPATDAPALNLTAAEAAETVVPSTVREHRVEVRLLRSKFVDKTYFSTSATSFSSSSSSSDASSDAGAAVSHGHRASFLSYAVEDTSSTVSAPGLPALRGDTFLLSFSLADLVATTVRVPRFGILPLLGVIGGLALLVFALFKLLYEYADAFCLCTRIQAARIRARVLRGEKVDIAPAPRGKDLVLPAAAASAAAMPSPPFVVTSAAAAPAVALHPSSGHSPAAGMGARFRQSLRLLSYAPTAVGAVVASSGSGKGGVEGAAAAAAAAGGVVGGGGGGGDALSIVKGPSSVPVLGSRTAPLIPGSSLNASAEAMSPEQLPETTNPFFRAGGRPAAAAAKTPPPGSKKQLPVFSAVPAAAAAAAAEGGSGAGGSGGAEGGGEGGAEAGTGTG